jgi:hypothetical protein
MKLSTETAIKDCHLNDMTLASPQSQEEYENLRFLWKVHQNGEAFKWKDNAAIAGYLSSNTKIWSESGEKLRYNVTWARGEPNNVKGNEYCMFLNFRGDVASSDEACSDNDNPYICEFDKSRDSSFPNDDQEMNRFMKKLTDEAIKDKNVDIFLNQDNLKVPLIEAQLLCKIFGLEFFAKDVDVSNLGDLKPMDKFVCFKLLNGVKPIGNLI